MNVVAIARKLGTVLAQKLGLYKARSSAYYSIIYDLARKFMILPKLHAVVDLGAGSGDIIRAFRSSERMLVALDLDKNLLRKVNGLEPIVADAEKLPFRPSIFDMVLSISLLEHLQEPERCIAEIAGVLKRGGVCIVQLPNLQWLIEPHTKWPLLMLFPKSVRERIIALSGYPYINLDVICSAVVKWFDANNLYYVSMRKWWHHMWPLSVFPWPPAWFLAFRKD